MRVSHISVALSVAIAILMLTVPTVAAWDYVDRGTTVDFYTSDGGADSGTGWFSGGDNHPSINKAEAWSNCINVGYGASGWGFVWHIVECHATGYYKVELWGHYWGIGSAFGGADAFLRWDIKVEDCITGETHSGTIRMLEALGLWAFNEQGNFDSTMIFYGTSGHTYRIGLYAYASTAGVVGSASADGIGEQGGWFTHGRVSPYTYPPSGGGCVWGNSLVTMADGEYKKASQVRVDEEVLGYDLFNNSLVTERVISNSRARVNEIIDFNDGLLLVTPTNQPVYARNATYTGWVHDPLNMTIGWELFCPQSQSWVEITSMEFKDGNYLVNDIVTTVFNNYIANGVLVDYKTM